MMSNRNVPFFRDYLRVLGAAVSYAEAARRLRISENWVYKVFYASRAASQATPEGPSVFYFEEQEGDGEFRWFHDHVQGIVACSVEEIDAAARMRAARPTVVPTFYKGQRVPARDPALIGKPWLIDMLGLEDDLLRDADGNVIFETMEVQPSTDLVLAMLAAYSPKKFGKKLEVENKVSGGVYVVGQPQPQIAAPLPVEVIIDQSEAAGLR